MTVHEAHLKPSAARVLVLLRTRGASGLTQLEAIDRHGGTRLSGRVLELRQAGYDIETRYEGLDGIRYARYILHEAAVQMAVGWA